MYVCTEAAILLFTPCVCVLLIYRWRAHLGQGHQ